MWRIETDPSFHLLGHAARGRRPIWDLSARCKHCALKSQCKHCLPKPSQWSNPDFDCTAFGSQELICWRTLAGFPSVPRDTIPCNEHWWLKQFFCARVCGVTNFNYKMAAISKQSPREGQLSRSLRRTARLCRSKMLWVACDYALASANGKDCQYDLGKVGAAAFRMYCPEPVYQRNEP